MRLVFLGSAGEVGRSSILVEASGIKVLIDAGIKLGKEIPEFPEIPLELPAEVSSLIISHAHLDHVGFIPMLVKHGFKGSIYCTKPTRDLMHLLLADALGIAKERMKQGKLHSSAFYSQSDIDKAMKLVKVVDFKKSVSLGKGFSFKFYSSGHVIGGAQVLVQAEGKTLLYSSDINNRETSLLNGFEIPEEKIDFLIVESTYGSRKDLLPSLKAVSKDFADAVNSTFIAGGKVLVPVFAIGRGQELMFILENYVRSGYLPSETTVFLDGMINSASKICRQNVVFLRSEIPNRILHADDDPFKSPVFKVPKSRSKSEVLRCEFCVILATSGMLTGGPSVFYFKKLAPEKRNLIALVGYQSAGSIGRELLNGAKEIDVFGKKVKVNALVKKFAFSGHADFLGLLEYVRKTNPKKVFVVHGDSEKQPEFADALRKKLKKEVFSPVNQEVFEL